MKLRDMFFWCNPETAREHGTKCGKPYSDSKPLATKLQRTKGFTYSLVTKTSPKSGYALSVAKTNEYVFEGKPNAQQISAYIKNHLPALTADKRAHVGGWWDSLSKKTYLDVSLVTPDKKTALILAQKHHQLAIFDLNKKQVITTPKTPIHASGELQQGRVYFFFKHTACPEEIADAIQLLGAQ